MVLLLGQVVARAIRLYMFDGELDINAVLSWFSYLATHVEIVFSLTHSVLVIIYLEFGRNCHESDLWSKQQPNIFIHVSRCPGCRPVKSCLIFKFRYNRPFSTREWRGGAYHALQCVLPPLVLAQAGACGISGCSRRNTLPAGRQYALSAGPPIHTLTEKAPLIDYSCGAETF